MSDLTDADRCEIIGEGAICGTQMRECSRTSRGIRWCFHCRRRHEFWVVVKVPGGLSYYGPTADIEGVGRECSDLFPGRYYAWEAS